MSSRQKHLNQIVANTSTAHQHLVFCSCCPYQIVIEGTDMGKQASKQARFHALQNGHKTYVRFTTTRAYEKKVTP